MESSGVPVRGKVQWGDVPCKVRQITQKKWKKNPTKIPSFGSCPLGRARASSMTLLLCVSCCPHLWLYHPEHVWSHFTLLAQNVFPRVRVISVHPIHVASVTVLFDTLYECTSHN